MIITTAAQIERAKSWLNDVFVIANEIDDAKDMSYAYMQNSSDCDYMRDAALAVVKEIKFRQFANINSALAKIAGHDFSKSVKDLTKTVRAFEPEEAAYIAWFCKEYKIYWDDTVYTKEECDEFLTTYLGKALFEAKCFATQPDDIVSKKPIDLDPGKSGSKKRASSGTIDPATGKKAPADDYKTTGPQSGNARGLIGEPGVKEKFSEYAYSVEGTTLKGSTATALYIRPLDAAGIEETGVNRVFFGTSWKAYRNCICYFINKEGATRFLETFCIRNKLALSELTVTYKKADPNGYFKLNTGCGTCYVAAHKFNEMLKPDKIEEDVTEDVDLSEEVKRYLATPLEEENYPATDSIKDIDCFVDAYKHYDR